MVKEDVSPKVRPAFNAATFRFDRSRSPESKKAGLCPDCNEVKYLTKHHLRPEEIELNRVIAKRDIDGRLYVEICRECHDKREGMVPRKKDEYGEGWDSSETK